MPNARVPVAGQSSRRQSMSEQRSKRQHPLFGNAEIDFDSTTETLQPATDVAKQNSSNPGPQGILREDCIEGMHRLPEGIASLVFADPPFNIGFDYDVYDDTRDHHQYLDWSRKWIAEVYRLLKPTGAFWLAIGDEYAAELKLISQEIGFHCRSWVIWYYTFGVNCQRKFTRSHAHLFHFVKDPEQFTFREDRLENRIPSARQLVYADNRANPRGRLPDDTWILRPQDLQECFTTDEDTWYFPRVAGTFKERAGFHGCQMPEQLLGRIIRACSEPDELVVDPFSGSATTLAVAKKLGRGFLGFEISEEYATRGLARLASIRSGDPLDGAAEPLLTAPATPKGKGGKRGSRSSDPSTTTREAPPFGLDEQRQAEQLRTLTDAALRAAFLHVHQGYSLDRIIIDPELNQQFGAACLQRGLVGDLRSWNQALFRMRKAGQLADIATHARTEITWEACDSFLYASEIAVRSMLDRGFKGVDCVLSDPAFAAEFDEIAQRLAPGHTPLEYRWGALKLRKAAKMSRVRGAALASVPFDAVPGVPRERWGSLPATAAAYLIMTADGGQPCYAGTTLNLHNRIARQLSARSIQAAKIGPAADLIVRFVALDPDPHLLLAYQSQLVSKYRPRLNFLEFASAHCE